MVNVLLCYGNNCHYIKTINIIAFGFAFNLVLLSNQLYSVPQRGKSFIIIKFPLSLEIDFPECAGK